MWADFIGFRQTKRLIERVIGVGWTMPRGARSNFEAAF
jgi:hypothetical protein